MCLGGVGLSWVYKPVSWLNLHLAHEEKCLFCVGITKTTSSSHVVERLKAQNGIIALQTSKSANSPTHQLTNSPTHKLARLYINKEYIPVVLSICKETQKLALWFDIFLKKACVVFKKALPLHPLSGTKFSGSDWKRVHWKIYIDSSSTRADALVFSEASAFG